MNGAVEGMLKVLEDPRSDNADAALAGMVERYQAGGSAVLKPLKDRFRKLLTDPDPGVRRVAAWGLGRTGDLDVVPLLVSTLRHPREDDSVIAEARTSLQFLSRKIDGFGPPLPSTAEQRVEAAQKWLAWYNAIRPIDQTTQDDAASPAPASAAPATVPGAGAAPAAPPSGSRSEQP
jgi:HEAT repeat protein